MNSQNLSLLCIEGIDAKKFLQGQLTCHLDEVIPDQLQLGAHCNPQGRIISLFHLILHQDKYFLLMPQQMIPIAMNALKKYAVFFKVNLKEVTDHTLTQQIPTTWHTQNIQNGVPAIYPDTSEKFLPHELNLHLLNAISFNKGCYTGQEIIARMHYKGKLKTHLYQGKTSAQPTIGAEIYAQKGPAGHIVDYAEIGYNIYQLLFTANESDMKESPIFIDSDKKFSVDKL